MVKHNLVIASVLKPVDDTRMYEKFGITLSSLSNYHIHIAGFATNQKVNHPNISFHPLFDFSRLSINRFLAPLKFYKLLYKLKPKVVIVNSPDLLHISALCKILFGFELLYDVQENYYYNFLYTGVYSSPVKQILALAVRIVECLCAPAVSHFFLAEKTYIDELPFIGGRYTVIENKYNPVHKIKAPVKRETGKYRLLYSGTIGTSYGVFEAIKLAKALHAHDPRFSLTIIGYCAKADDYQHLISSVKDYPFIRLIGGKTLVPHRQIIEAIQEADIGLVCYRDNKSNRNRIPTKLYEYIYYKLPMLIPNNPIWVRYCRGFNAALVVDYSDFNSIDLLLHVRCFSFYEGISDQQLLSVLWTCEEKTLIRHI